MDPVRPGGQEHDLEVWVEQIQQRAHLLDDTVFATRVEERPPVLSRCLQIVLATGRVRQHAVEVDHDGPARVERLAVPRPMLGEVPHARR